MTRLRAALVNGTSLAEIARVEEIGDRLHLGPGELKSGGFRRDSILADAFEALIAAIYEDAGWAACRDIVRGLFAERVAAGAGTPKDAKTRLQEWLQARSRPLPVYELTDCQRRGTCAGFRRMLPYRRPRHFRAWQWLQPPRGRTDRGRSCLALPYSETRA